MPTFNQFSRRLNVALTVSVLLSACGSDLPQVRGEYRPINKQPPLKVEANIPRIFDFKFKGTATDALIALQSKQSQLEILEPQGKVVATKIDLDLRQVSLESALRVLALQGGATFDVVHKSDPALRSDSAYIKFLR
ncbi:hypothetical protein [Acidovorax facilis]|jgi:hypothetical protein|uniref:hypothetical protein n=1 Tax=Acidovorax facilis TaxID=12917 RepID=UPI003D65ECC2